MNYYLQTFGCQMNISDSERIEAYLQQSGWKKINSVEKADVVIYNSCSVRQKAEDRVIGLIHNLEQDKKKHPNIKVGITGCMVRKTGVREDPLFKRIPNLDFVFKIEELSQLHSILNSFYPSLVQRHDGRPIGSYLQIEPRYDSPHQAYVPIMTGCNNYCSYCIVPYARGREVSRPVQDILCEVEQLADKGCREITLLGQNVNSYVLDESKVKGKQDFVVLLEKLNALSGIERIRFTSSHPKDLSHDLIEAYASLSKLCEHLHLALQSGDDEILRRMNRHYTAEEYYNLVAFLRKRVPHIAISTDIIVGFPGETDAQFQNTVELVKKIQFDLIYIAQYSPRPGTYAAREFEDDVPHDVKERRWHELNSLLKKMVLKKNQKYIGKSVEVLVEEVGDGWVMGKMRNWKTVRVRTKDRNQLEGELVEARIVEAKAWVLEGKQADSKCSHLS